MIFTLKTSVLHFVFYAGSLDDAQLKVSLDDLLNADKQGSY